MENVVISINQIEEMLTLFIHQNVNQDGNGVYQLDIMPPGEQRRDVLRSLATLASIRIHKQQKEDWDDKISRDAEPA